VNSGSDTKQEITWFLFLGTSVISNNPNDTFLSDIQVQGYSRVIRNSIHSFDHPHHPAESMRRVPPTWAFQGQSARILAKSFPEPALGSVLDFECNTSTNHYFQFLALGDLSHHLTLDLQRTSLVVAQEDHSTSPAAHAAI
jgi:hypothetical protein